jgi:hypothetical protein
MLSSLNRVINTDMARRGCVDFRRLGNRVPAIDDSCQMPRALKRGLLSRSTRELAVLPTAALIAIEGPDGVIGSHRQKSAASNQ